MLIHYYCESYQSLLDNDDKHNEKMAYPHGFTAGKKNKINQIKMMFHLRDDHQFIGDIDAIDYKLYFLSVRARCGY